MNNKVKKIIKLINELETKHVGDEYSIFSQILKAILEKQKYDYENLYQFYHKINKNLVKKCEICKKDKYSTHCIVCQNHFEDLTTCYCCGDVICVKCCPFNTSTHMM